MRFTKYSEGWVLTLINGVSMNKQLAESLVKDAKEINDSVSQVMNMCVELTEERDEIKRQRDEALGKMPLFEKNEAEASELKAEDLNPALILALCQRDIALRSVRKVHEIHNLLDAWEKDNDNGVGSVEADFNITKEIRQILRWHLQDFKGAV